MVLGALTLQFTASPVVAEVIDGESFIVTEGFRSYEVRLLNVDTPDLVGSHDVPQCLGREAADYLSSLLPAGTPVTLVKDGATKDRFGRVLAGVYRDGTLVNAEVTRAGFGVPIVNESNYRFFSDVASTASQAQANQVGLFDPEVDCTLTAKVRANGIPEELLHSDPATLDATAIEQYTAKVRQLMTVWDSFDQARGNDNEVLHSAWTRDYLHQLKQRYWDETVAPARKQLNIIAAAVPGVELPPDLCEDDQDKAPTPPPTDRGRPKGRAMKPGLVPSPKKPAPTTPAPSPTQPDTPSPTPSPATPSPSPTTPTPEPPPAPEPSKPHKPIPSPTPSPNEPDKSTPGPGKPQPGKPDRPGTAQAPATIPARES
ncbi:hypothetical protein BSZ39_11085 [Bowdeniella nasicola]|uniref:TNase-like domain-containing protein n=2 Tax=Bowdeniella nasicola TaxID=208480 RepID=A0A1Q5PZS8_9ACTO|nr:hypothetical protein BSZ39_11085 [Bowdeniella nasicola]